MGRNPRPAASSPFFRRHSWFNTASVWEMVLMAITIGAIVFSATVLLQLFLAHQGWPVAVMLWSSDAVAGLFAGLLSLRLMRHARERQRALDARLRLVAEMNHQVRNALDLIQLSAHMTHNQESIANISSAVDRIQRTLREVLEGRDEEDSEAVNKDHHA